MPGLHLRDLALVEEAMAADDSWELDEKGGGSGTKKINFVKCKMVWAIIVDLLRFQPVPFNFHHVHQIATFLRHLNVKEYSDDEMFLLSLNAEPRNFDVLL